PDSASGAGAAATRATPPAVRSPPARGPRLRSKRTPALAVVAHARLVPVRLVDLDQAAVERRARGAGLEPGLQQPVRHGDERLTLGGHGVAVRLGDQPLPDRLTGDRRVVRGEHLDLAGETRLLNGGRRAVLHLVPETPRRAEVRVLLQHRR